MSIANKKFFSPNIDIVREKCSYRGEKRKILCQAGKSNEDFCFFADKKNRARW
jgi:hypothetical protein